MSVDNSNQWYMMSADNAPDDDAPYLPQDEDEKEELRRRLERLKRKQEDKRRIHDDYDDYEEDLDYYDEDELLDDAPSKGKGKKKRRKSRDNSIEGEYKPRRKKNRRSDDEW